MLRVHKIAPTNHEKIIGKFAPPKKPDVAAFIDSILLIDGPAINLSKGMANYKKNITIFIFMI